MKKTHNISENEHHEVDEALTPDFNAGETENSQNDVVEKETEILRAKVEELNDKFLRQAAEFENFKRRNAKERIELIQTAAKDVITDLLDVVDDSERAQKQMETTNELELIKEGVSVSFLRRDSTVSFLSSMIRNTRLLKDDIA